MDWLVAPIDPDRVHEVGLLLSWHARLMVLAWAVLIPLGVLAARFFKITPRQRWPAELDNRFWWRSHLLLQNLGFVLMLLGIGLVWYAPRHTDQTGIHDMIGWSLWVLAFVQVAGGYLRGSKGGPEAGSYNGPLRGDHYDMTGRRILFERVHKSLGYLALAVAMAATGTGLWQANAPRWFFIVIALWWILLGVVFCILQRRGLAVDTYQAIWGPGDEHPGNARTKPIGFGVRRQRSGRLLSDD